MYNNTWIISLSYHGHKDYYCCASFLLIFCCCCSFLFYFIHLFIVITVVNVFSHLNSPISSLLYYVHAPTLHSLNVSIFVYHIFTERHPLVRTLTLLLSITHHIFPLTNFQVCQSSTHYHI